MGAQDQCPTATPSTRSSSPGQDQPFDHAPLGGKRRQLRKIFVKRNMMSMEYFFLRSALGWGKKSSFRITAPLARDSLPPLIYCPQHPNWLKASRPNNKSLRASERKLPLLNIYLWAHTSGRSHPREQSYQARVHLSCATRDVRFQTR